MNRDEVVRWVGQYERAWRDGDTEAVAALFSDDAAYRASPYEPSTVGHDAIKGLWLDDPGTRFSMSARVVAVDGDVAVVRVDVVYGHRASRSTGTCGSCASRPDGRVADFEEWAYWPGKPYSATEARPSLREPASTSPPRRNAAVEPARHGRMGR